MILCITFYVRLDTDLLVVWFYTWLYAALLCLPL